MLYKQKSVIKFTLLDFDINSNIRYNIIKGYIVKKIKLGNEYFINA